MSNKNILFLILIGFVSFSCIKDDVLDDFVPPKIKVTNKLVSLTNGLSFTFNARYSNNIGNRENVTINWASSDESVVFYCF